MTATRNRLSIFCLVIMFLLGGWLLFWNQEAGAAPTGQVTVLVPTSFEMTGGDPHTSTGDTASTLISLLHDGLCVKLVDGKIHPAIAKSWTVEPNWKFVTFKLNRTAKFHDNTPVTAEDVKFSLDRVKRLKGYFKAVFDNYIDRVEVVDPDTVKVYLKMPMVGIFNIFAKYIGIVPKHYVEKVGDVAYAQKPIGCRPLQGRRYKTGRSFQSGGGGQPLPQNPQRQKLERALYSRVGYPVRHDQIRGGRHLLGRSAHLSCPS